MQSFDGIAKNFRLLLVQVTKQLETTTALLDNPHEKLVKSILSGEDYVDTQRMMIENECFKFIQSSDERNGDTVDAVRAVNVITNNLERIADMSVNIARQTGHLRDWSKLQQFDYRGYLSSILDGVGTIADALFDRNSSLALRICRIEEHLDFLYRGDLRQIMENLRGGESVDQHITVLFILHYLERMGDALKNVGEAIIFAVLGERLKVHQYRMLDQALAASGSDKDSIDHVEVSSIWGTRSGVRIGRLVDEREEKARRVLFKEGNPDKLQRESASIERWQRLAPGMVPEVVEYQRKGEDAAMLLQYLDGDTIQEVVVNADPKLNDEALSLLETRMRDIWAGSRTDQPVNARFLDQLRSRLDDVSRVYPELRVTDYQLGSVCVPTFSVLLERATGIDEQLSAPFSVFIHGDLNLDNIIYNAKLKTLHLIDVHRSRDFDYVQDVSVFLTSAFRMPVFASRARRSIESAALRFLKFARTFAADQGDQKFEARLALGLVRSMTTSMRFEMNRRFAHAMSHRASLLLNSLLNHQGKPWPAYRVADSVLLY